MKQHYRSAYGKLEADEAFKETCKKKMAEKNGRDPSPMRWIVPTAAAACLCLCAAVLFPLIKNSMIPEPPVSLAPAAPSLGSSEITLSDSPDEALRTDLQSFEKWFEQNPLDQDLVDRLSGVQTEEQTVFTQSLFSSYWYDEMEYAYENLQMLMQTLGLNSEELSRIQKEWNESSKTEVNALLSNHHENSPASMESVKNIYRNRAKALYKQLFDLHVPGEFYYEKNNTPQNTFYPLLNEQAGFWWNCGSGRHSHTDAETNIGAVQPPFAQSGSTTLELYAEEKTAYNPEDLQIHSGLDLSPINKGEYAVAGNSGTVVFAGKSANGFGVVLKIGEADYLVYTHLYELFVSTGDSLSQGDPLGPCATDDEKVYLHFSVVENGKLQNPRQYLP